MREELEELIRTWNHRADTMGNDQAASATLMCATDLERLIARELERSRQADTDPAPAPVSTNPPVEGEPEVLP